MKCDPPQSSFNPLARFRLRFQRRLTDYLVVDEGSVAEGFGLVWEKTLADVPLDDDAQGELYRELIIWARSDQLFTWQKQPDRLQALEITVHGP